MDAAPFPGSTEAPVRRRHREQFMKLPPAPKLRDLKAAGQLLEPVLKIGKAGVSEEFLQALRQALSAHELVKIRFDEFKEEKRTLAPMIAAKTGSQLVMRVGHVAVYYRPRAAPAPNGG